MVTAMYSFGKHLTLPIGRPIRLLDLIIDSGNAECARLVEYHDGCTKYATLSYVLGPGPHSWRTSRDNVKERLILSKRSYLPAMFADAISIAERLELRYMWIDALCIVQDDLFGMNKGRVQDGGHLPWFLHHYSCIFESLLARWYFQP